MFSGRAYEGGNAPVGFVDLTPGKPPVAVARASMEQHGRSSKCLRYFYPLSISVLEIETVFRQVPICQVTAGPAAAEPVQRRVSVTVSRESGIGNVRLGAQQRNDQVR